MMKSQSPNANASDPPTSQEPISSNHVSLKVDPLNESKLMTCLYCQKTCKGGGINRMKQHLQSLNEINDKKRSEKQPMNFVATRVQCRRNDNDDGKKPTTSSGKEISSSGLITSHFAPWTIPGAQLGIKSVLASKGIINHVGHAVMKWLCDVYIPLNALRSRYFQPMLDALATIDPGYKAPSYHNCRTNLLKDLVQEVQMSVDKLRKDWATYGCTIMAEGWADTRSQTLINFLVYCPTGTEIGEMDYVANVVQRASRITKFVYNHIFILLMLRKRLGWSEIVRLGATRFATNFIALDSILKHMHDLQNLVTNRSFIDSRYAKDAKGKEVIQIVLDSEFSAQCKMIVGFTSPLVSALRLADFEFKPAMGYMYHVMLKAKESLKKFFNYKKAEYDPIMDIIDRRWNRQMGQRLHLVGYYYDPKSKVKSLVVMSAVFYVIEKLAIKLGDVEIKLNKELTLFENCCGNFGRPFSVKTFKSMPPSEWWSRFGCDTQNLKRIVVRIFSQMCNSSGCERNWSVFEHIHTKRRNMLEHQRLNDLAYVHYNLHVKDGKKNESLNPIGHEHVDVIEDWIVHNDEDPPLLDGNENDDMFKADETTFSIMESPSRKKARTDVMIKDTNLMGILSCRMLAKL
uniref:BED-type domain-containing protein n=1 Tax=Nelumbo nucifera TaxID=4432 RepID=A0A822ZIN3_NELNU|nr:TPA_asm: hypothetical protein HUJ06_004204 [Nelumbo nucifera]